MEEGDLLVLRVTIGVSFALLPLFNKSIRGLSLFFLFYSCFILSLFFYFCFMSLFL